jgi:hypothetical protein
MLFESNDDQVGAAGEPDAADGQAPERCPPSPGFLRPDDLQRTSGRRSLPGSGPIGVTRSA